LTHSADIALLVTLGASFMIMLVGVVRCLSHYCRCRRDIVRRIKALRIDKMLNHAGISRARYLRKAKPLTIEKHLLVCEDCGTTDICDECLEQGKHIPEYTFCRNYRGLIRYRLTRNRNRVATSDDRTSRVHADVRLKGTPLSPGIAVGRTCFYRRDASDPDSVLHNDHRHEAVSI